MNLGSHLILISIPLIPTHSFISHANIIPNPSYVVHNSCQTCKICYYIHIHHHTIILNQDRSLGNHQTSQSQHCLAQHLAQAEGSRSGETCSLRRASPSPRRGHRSRSMGNAGSRLSEIPLAWASCLLAQKLSEPPRRAPCFISLRRDWLAWARLTGLATVLHCNSHDLRPNNTCKVLSHIQTTDPTIQSTNNA